MSYSHFGQVHIERQTTSLSRLIPDIPSPSNLNRTQQSPNNALAGRTNETRVLQRIEDIYGTVRSYPSLLQPVYSNILIMSNMNIAICALVVVGMLLKMSAMATPHLMKITGTKSRVLIHLLRQIAEAHFNDWRCNQ